MNRLRNIFMIEFYNIFRLCSLQLPMIALKCILMATLNHIWFQNCYCKCLSGNFIIKWWSPHKRVDLRSQEMQKTIPPLVIPHYGQLFHPNLRIFINGTGLCVVVNAVYLPKVFIYHYYHDMIFIWGRSTIQVKMHKTEGLVKNIISYLRNIKNLWCHMGVIYMQQNLTWTCL